MIPNSNWTPEELDEMEKLSPVRGVVRTTWMLRPFCCEQSITSRPGSSSLYHYLLLLMEEILHHLGYVNLVVNGKNYISTGAGFLLTRGGVFATRPPGGCTLGQLRDALLVRMPKMFDATTVQMGGNFLGSLFKASLPYLKGIKFPDEWRGVYGKVSPLNLL